MTKILIDRAVVEQVLDAYSRRDYDFGKYMEALRAALAEQPAEQEPVAEVVKHEATVRLQWISADTAHNAKPGPLYLAPQPAIPPGYKLVPVDRSYDMRVQALIAFNSCKGDRDDALGEAWQAMLAAAPEAPQPAKRAEQTEPSDCSDSHRPIAWLNRDQLDELQSCNGMSIWAESPQMYAPLDPYNVQAPSHLVAVYLTNQPAKLEPLTQDQLADLVPPDDTPMSLGEAFVKFARAIERAHGIGEQV